MSAKMREESLAKIVFIVIFLGAARDTNAQAFLLTFSDEQVGSHIGQRNTEIIDSTNITEVFTIPTSKQIPTEFSQGTMDAITIVWYVSTFMALLAFFLLMACSDRRCGTASRTPTPTQDQQQQPPPTPAPSYSEFAPPSYDTVMKKSVSSVFVVQVPYVEAEKDKDAPPPFTFHTVNELQKFTS